MAIEHNEVLTLHRDYVRLRKPLERQPIPCDHGRMLVAIPKTRHLAGKQCRFVLTGVILTWLEVAFDEAFKESQRITTLKMFCRVLRMNSQQCVKIKCLGRGSNLQPSPSEGDALSN